MMEIRRKVVKERIDIEEDLVLCVDDIVFEESVKCNDIICENGRKSFKVKGNIDARDIVARNIDVCNIVAWNISAQNINAQNIVAWNIDTWNIDAGNIDAWKINTLDIDARNINAHDIKYFTIE
jgi:hypothetical protein